MRSESHYCTLVEYIICHAAFTGCHLAERLQCSWKPLSDSDDTIKIGASCMVGAQRPGLCALHCSIAGWGCRDWQAGVGEGGTSPRDPRAGQQLCAPRAELSSEAGLGPCCCALGGSAPLSAAPT